MKQRVIFRFWAPLPRWYQLGILSENILFSDHVIADYNSLEEYGGTL
jgi:hypothetical protein